MKECFTTNLFDSLKQLLLGQLSFGGVVGYRKCSNISEAYLDTAHRDVSQCKKNE
jgi:hypothetical protein